jgi:hypothetical protein
VRFVDLDAEFTARHGDVSAYLDTRSPEREEQVIRTRFPTYAGLPARKVETMRPVAAVVAELLAVIVAVEPPAGPRLQTGPRKTNTAR